MSRTCWWIDRAWVRPDNTVPKCTCAEDPPDFNVKLPAFMDFSPTELPTTGMTTVMTTAPETPPATTSATPITNATTLRQTTSKEWSLRTVSTVTQRAQEAAENSASTLKGATPQSHLTSKSLSTLSATTVNRNTTYVFLRTEKPSVPTDSEGFTSPQLDKDQSFSPVTESTVRTTTEGLLEVKDSGFDSHNVNQTTRFVEEGRENDSKYGSRNAPSRDFAVGTTKRLPLDRKSRVSMHNGTSTQSPKTNTLHTNTIATSNPSNTLEGVTNTYSTNLTTNDAVTSKIPPRINVSMVTKSSSNVNSRTSSTTEKSRRRTSGRVTPLSSSVVFSSVSSSSSISSGGIHVSSRSTPAPHPHSSASPGLNASRGGDSRLMLIATSSSGGACVLLLLFTLFIFLIYRSKEKRQLSRDIDVIPVTNEEPSLQGTPTPGELKRQLASPEGNNNPTLTESQDRGIDGSANSSSNNGAPTNTIVTLKDASLKGDPV